MGLPRINRLKRRQDFSLVYQKGRRRKSRHLSLVILRSQSAGNGKLPVEVAPQPMPLFPTRIGISISQKVSKRAVVRNRIKRQIRAAIRSLLPNFSYGWNLVVVVQPQAVQCDYFQFLRELEQLLIDAEVLNGHS